MEGILGCTIVYVADRDGNGVPNDTMTSLTSIRSVGMKRQAWSLKYGRRVYNARDRSNGTMYTTIGKRLTFRRSATVGLRLSTHVMTIGWFYENV